MPGMCVYVHMCVNPYVCVCVSIPRDTKTQSFNLTIGLTGAGVVVYTMDKAVVVCIENIKQCQVGFISFYVDWYCS
jgi:hypothetical protein